MVLVLPANNPCDRFGGRAVCLFLKYKDEREKACIFDRQSGDVYLSYPVADTRHFDRSAFKFVVVSSFGSIQLYRCVSRVRGSIVPYRNGRRVYRGETAIWSAKKVDKKSLKELKNA